LHTHTHTHNIFLHRAAYYYTPFIEEHIASSHRQLTDVTPTLFFSFTHTHYGSTSAKIAALEAKLRQMVEEDMGLAVGVATKKPRISSSRPTAQTKKYVTGQKSTNSVQRVVKPSHWTNRSRYPLT
jgi:hypothetical protein